MSAAASRPGEAITARDVFFAMPVQDGQLVSGNWRPGLVADRDYAGNAPLSASLAGQGFGDEQLVYQIMLQVRGMLNKANIHINEDAEIEISHHFGLRRFREYGAVIVTCINRQYAKKLVIQLPRQKHPYHFHKQKEETFQLLEGDLEIVKDGARTSMRVGDTFLVGPESGTNSTPSMAASSRRSRPPTTTTIPSTRIRRSRGSTAAIARPRSTIGSPISAPGTRCDPVMKLGAVHAG